MLGVGGVLAEAVADVVFRLVPTDRHDAADMIDDLRAQALLGPFRGEPPVNREQLVDVLTGLSDLAAARPDVASVDLNPLIVAAGAPVAVDALVVVDGT
jgi:succinyl-CoA synthetase beta subunit